MTDDPRVQQLLEVLYDSDSTPEAVCVSCPDLLPVVRKQWRRIRRVRADLDALFPSPDEPTPLREKTDLPQVPGYEVEAVLGRGGMGIVFQAKHLRLNRRVALKMALGFWRHGGEPRHRILVMEHSYHGDTVGAMSVGERGPFTAAYEPLLFDVARIPFPIAGRESATFAALEAHCRADAAAFIVEPLVLGAGGMLMYSPAVLAELRNICARHGVLFIADEVMTGWGRTGTMFACEQAGISPDIACYSKGLTGGSLPLAVTLCRHEIFAAHYAEDRRRTFFHSSSFTANPIACAAALANLEIWESEPVRARIAALKALQAQHLERFRDDARFEQVRQTGTITALDVRAPDGGYFAALGPRLAAAFQAGEVLLRPLGNTLYVLPPYCVTEGDLDRVYGAILASVDALG